MEGIFFQGDKEKEDVLIGRRGLNVEIMIVSETLRRVKGRTHISI